MTEKEYRQHPAISRSQLFTEVYAEKIHFGETKGAQSDGNAPQADSASQGNMGIEMDLSENELKRAIELCKHMIGLDRSRPYHRHEKAFYKPYRNYFKAPITGDKTLDKLPYFIIKKEISDISVWYTLTSDGLKWLGRQLKITIKQEG